MFSFLSFLPVFLSLTISCPQGQPVPQADDAYDVSLQRAAPDLPSDACGNMSSQKQKLLTDSLNEEIPEELYRVIAEILAFAFHIRGRTPGDAQPEENNPSMDQGA